MFTESTDRVEEKLKKRLRKAVLKVAENIGGKLFGLEAFGEDEEKNIADLQFGGIGEPLRHSLIKFISAYLQQAGSLHISRKVFIGNLFLATIEDKFGLQNSMGAEVVQAVEALNAHKRLQQMSSNPNDELIFLDNVADDGSVRRTYFKNASQLEDILERGSYRQEGSADYDSKEMDKTKDMWMKATGSYTKSNTLENQLNEVPAVYIHSTHPEVREALEASREEDELNNVLTIDFEELFDQQTTPIAEGKVHQKEKLLVSFGTQTEDDEKSGICSKCLRCGERTDVKIKLDFGDTPIKNPLQDSKAQILPKIISPGQEFKPSEPPLKSKINLSSQKGPIGSKMVQRPLFRSKWQVSSPPQIQLLAKQKAPIVQKTTSKSTKNSYIGKFETKKQLYENSDMKYFSGSRQLDNRMPGRKLQSRSQANLSTSFSRTLEDSSESKFAGRSKRARIQRSILEKSRSVASIGREEAEISLIGLQSAIKQEKRLPISVDINLHAISLAEDSDHKSYVWLRDQRGVPMAWSPIESLHD